MGEPRTVKLFCPSLSKLVRLAAWDEQRLDLGSIARAFGLEPSTVKINGHFVSRGVDLVSSSVTWRSLLKFFSTKGLSTGEHDRDALVVDGKLTKAGSKRSYDSQDASDGIPGFSPRPTYPEDINSPRNKKLRDSSSGCKGDSLEDLCFLNKLRLNETNSDFQGNRDDHLGTISRTPFKCRYSSEKMKRPREREVITPTPCKRLR